MVTRIMGEDACDNKTEITRYVFLFLTRLHQFDMTYRTDEQNQNKSKKPKLFSMPNLLSLLNIVDDNRRFGHLRMMWELGGMGEKSVQKVRDYVINNWSINSTSPKTNCNVEDDHGTVAFFKWCRCHRSTQMIGEGSIKD